MADAGDQAWAITNLMEAADLLAGEAERRLQDELGISLAQKEVLFRLTLTGGAMRMTELARALLFSPSGTTRLVDRMVAAGQVDRHGLVTDRRSTVVSITPAGTRLFRRTAPVMQGVVRDLFSPHVSDRDVDALVRILGNIVVAGGRWEDRSAGADFEQAIRRSGQPSVRTGR